MTLYYSDDFREELIELSDLHIFWYMKFGQNQTDAHFECLVNFMLHEFEELYATSLILTGRSGRHVCVKDTPENRRCLMNMQRTVWRMQNKILKKFDDGWRINRHGTLFHRNGSICIGSVGGRDIVTRH